MKTGIFGGAFNPVHNGHLNLADIYFDALNLDRIIFIPTYKPPHKTDSDFASCNDRLNMLSLALTNPAYEISTIEFEREDISYTYDTLNELKVLYPDDSLYLIIGEDQFMSFDKWYRYRDILDMVTLCSFPRNADNNARFQMLKKSDELNARKSIVLDMPPLKVSSSEVREKIKNGESVSALVPFAVEQYIKEKGLYSV